MHSVLEDERLVASLSSGAYFGERSLLTREPANATLRAADSETVCYSIGRHDFQALFGSLQDILDDQAARRDAESKEPPPPTWDELDIRETIGMGTFGAVKRVTRKHTRREYALKCFCKREVIRSGQLADVLNENRTLQVLHHEPHVFIAKMHTTYQSADQLFQLMEVI